MRNLRFKTLENIIEENNYSEKNNSIITENTEKSEILIMNAEIQVQAINDLTQAIKEIGIFENNVIISSTFYGKDEEDPYEFLKQFNRIGKINRWSDKRKLKIIANSLKRQVSY